MQKLYLVVLSSNLRQNLSNFYTKIHILKSLKFIRGARREQREMRAFLGSFRYNGFANLYFKRIKNGEYFSLLLFCGGCEQDQ
ncbi:hypothetical protein [Campylobacter concisus]|uniref:hypothetical protein n=1 Tax=Campylobacter concisus TaxID=199 RepID=UPI00165EDE96|nr:hypothetical protein [Campylobacter concisus]